MMVERDCPSRRNYHLPRAPQLEMELLLTFPLHAGALSDLSLRMCSATTAWSSHVQLPFCVQKASHTGVDGYHKLDFQGLKKGHKVGRVETGWIWKEFEKEEI